VIDGDHRATVDRHRAEDLSGDPRAGLGRFAAEVEERRLGRRREPRPELSAAVLERDRESGEVVSAQRTHVLRRAVGGERRDRLLRDRRRVDPVAVGRDRLDVARRELEPARLSAGESPQR